MFHSPTWITCRLGRRFGATSLLVFLSLVLAGCSASETAMMDKMDTPLRQKLISSGSTDSNELLSVIVRCSHTITEADASLMRQTGVALGSISGDICTARGFPEQIKKLSALDVVRSLELSTPNQPSNVH